VEPIFQDLSTSLSLKDRAYLVLRDLIITGKIEPGDRLPEEELSKRMNISRVPIREALMMLESEGLVTMIPRKGAIVSEITEKSICEIWEVRSLLEPFAAKSSVGLIPKEEIIRVETMIHQALTNLDDFELYMKSDLAIHKLLYEYIDNDYLKELIETTSSRSLRVRYFTEKAVIGEDEDVEKTVCAEHLQIIDTIKNLDSDAVYNSVQTHIKNGWERTVKAFRISRANKSET